MFHHLVLLRFTSDSTAEAHRAVARALSDLPREINEIRSYEVHLDARLSADNAQLSVHATFDDEAAWRTYSDHPAHQAVLQGRIKPILESAMRTQFTDESE